MNNSMKLNFHFKYPPTTEKVSTMALIVISASERLKINIFVTLCNSFVIIIANIIKRFPNKNNVILV